MKRVQVIIPFNPILTNQNVIRISEEYIFIVGGDYPNVRQTEIVAISAEATIPDCLTALSDHPNPIYYGAGGALQDSGE